jgi:uncharacterized membrane protein
MANLRSVSPTPATRGAAFVALLTVVATAIYLLLEYPQLPDLLPVHFNRHGLANGWQFRTLPRVLIPVGVQSLLAVIFGSIAVLLLSRPQADHDPEAPDVRAAATAAEAVVLIACVWVVFQGYAAFSLTRLWLSPRATLPFYNLAELGCVVLSAFIGYRAHRRLGRPAPRPFVASHWRFGQLYRNSADPALFVPTRDGRRWTLNFGRPVAGTLLGLILIIGVLGPTVILALALR